MSFFKSFTRKKIQYNCHITFQKITGFSSIFEGDSFYISLERKDKNKPTQSSSVHDGTCYISTTISFQCQILGKSGSFEDKEYTIYVYNHNDDTQQQHQPASFPIPFNLSSYIADSELYDHTIQIPFSLQSDIISASQHQQQLQLHIHIKTCPSALDKNDCIEGIIHHPIPSNGRRDTSGSTSHTLHSSPSQDTLSPLPRAGTPSNTTAAIAQHQRRSVVPAARKDSLLFHQATQGYHGNQGDSEHSTPYAFTIGATSPSSGAGRSSGHGSQGTTRPKHDGRMSIAGSGPPNQQQQHSSSSSAPLSTKKSNKNRRGTSHAFHNDDDDDNDDPFNTSRPSHHHTRYDFQDADF